MTLAMTWQEWVQHDAVGLAECVRRGDVSAAELAAQAAAGVACRTAWTPQGHLRGCLFS